MWDGRANNWVSIYSLLQMEKTEEKTSPKTRKKGCKLGALGWEEMISWFAWRWKSNSTITKIFEDDGRKGNEKDERKRARLGTEKWPKRWRPTWMNSEGGNPKIAPNSRVAAK